MLCLSQRDKISSLFLFIFPHSSSGIIRYCLVLIWVFVPKTIRRPFRFCLLKIVLYRSTSRSHSSIAFISTLSYTVAIHDVDFNVFSKTGLWLIISEEFVYFTKAISPSQMSSFLHVWTRTVTSHFRRRLCRISEIFLKQFSEKKKKFSYNEDDRIITLIKLKPKVVELHFISTGDVKQSELTVSWPEC